MNNKSKFIPPSNHVSGQSIQDVISRTSKEKEPEKKKWEDKEIKEAKVYTKQTSRTKTRKEDKKEKIKVKKEVKEESPRAKRKRERDCQDDSPSKKIKYSTCHLHTDEEIASDVKRYVFRFQIQFDIYISSHSLLEIPTRLCGVNGVRRFGDWWS